MKLSFNFKKKEASLVADVEGLVEKSLENRSKRIGGKNRYQIKQEEKRKNKELEHKQKMQETYIWLGVMIFIIVVCIGMAILSNIFGWE